MEVGSPASPLRLWSPIPGMSLFDRARSIEPFLVRIRAGAFVSSGRGTKGLTQECVKEKDCRVERCGRTSTLEWQLLLASSGAD